MPNVYTNMSTDELWLLHQNLVNELKARLLEQNRQLDAKLAILGRPNSASIRRAKVDTEDRRTRQSALESA